MRALVWILLGYLSGSVLYAYELPWRLAHVDVREASDDRNPGTANAFICAGTGVGILVVACELLKGFVPVWLASMRIPPRAVSFAAVIMAPVIGHAYPIFYGGRGGKAIAVSFGVLLGLVPRVDALPLLFLIVFYLLFSLLLIIRSHSRRSIVTFLCFGAACLLFVKNPVVAAGCLGIAGIVIHKHRAAV